MFWWIILAIALSLFWGIYGIKEDKNEIKKWKRKDMLIKRAGIFFSEFIGSVAGWVCLYLLVYYRNHSALEMFDVFLGTITVVGISGYSYKIMGSIGKFKVLH